MGTGYVRADTSNNIANGNVIDADDLDGEFNAVQTAFNASSGHTHDGTSAEGAPVTVLGPGQDVVASTSQLKPKTTNTIDLGTSTLLYKDAYLQGNMYFRDTALKIVSSTDGQLDIEADTELEITAPTVDIDASTAVTIDTTTLTITGAANVSGDLDVDNININGNAITSTDSNGNIALTPNGTGEVDISKVDIDGGAIDGTVIGASSAAAITGTAITGTSFVIGSADINEAELETIDGVTAGTVSASKAIVVDGNKDFTGARNITLTGELDAATLDVSGNADIDGTLETDALSINGTTVTSTAAELNILDGVTATAAEINALDGITSTVAELNILDGVTATAAELNYNDITTLGTSQASKVVTADANGDVTISEELKAKSYNETYSSISSSSNALVVNCETANVFEVVLSENITSTTFSNPPASGTAHTFAIKVKQDASASGYSLTWPTSVDWPNGTNPALTSSANAVDQFVFYTHDGGTTYYGFLAGRNLS